jgi:glutathione S-transferase
MMTLYHGANSVCSQKARLVFAETGTAYESALLAIHEAINSMTFATVIREQELQRRTPAEIEAWLASTPNPQTAAKRRDLMEKGAGSVYVDGARHVLAGVLRDMAAALESGVWLCGAAYSLSDLALTAYVDRLERLGMAGLWSTRHPAVVAWLCNCRTRPSYAAAIEAFVPAGSAEASRAAGERAWPAIAARLH